MVSWNKSYGQISRCANAGYSFKRHVSDHTKMVAAFVYALNNFVVAHCCGIDLYVAQSRKLHVARVALRRVAKRVRRGDFVSGMRAACRNLVGNGLGAQGCPASRRRCATVRRDCGAWKHISLAP